MILGAAFGSVAGYFRPVDAVLMRIMDGLMAIPTVLLAIALTVILGANLQNVIIAIVVVDTPRMTRVARASVLSLREQPFVDAARAIGAQNSRILIRHVIPNLLAPSHRHGHIRRRRSHAHRGISQLPRRGYPSRRNPKLGQHNGRGPPLHPQGHLGNLLPGPRSSSGRNRDQPLAGDGLRDILDPKLAHRM